MSTLVNLATNPSFESVTAGTTVVRTNLFTTPGFEVDTSGWAATGSAAITRSTAAAHTGAASMRAVCDGAAGGQGAYTVTKLAILPGAAYTVSAWVKANPGAVIYIEIGEWTAASALIGAGRRQGAITTATGEWQRLHAVITTSATATQADVVIRNRDAVANTLFIDSTLLEQTDQLRPYFDGDATDALGFDYGWTGAVGASTSTAKAAVVEVRRNLCSNPSFEAGVTGWGPVRGSVAQNVGYGLFGPGRLLFTTNEVGYFPRAQTVIGGLVAGEWLAVSAHINASTGAVHRIGVQWTDSALAAIGPPVESTTSTLSGTRLSVISQAPAGAAGANIWLGTNDAAPSGTVVGWDGVLIEKSNTLGGYFDGNANTGDFLNVWAGAANASASVQQGRPVAGWASEGVAALAWQSYAVAGDGPCMAVQLPTNAAPGNSAATAAVAGPTVVGQTYTAAVRLYRPSGAGVAHLGVSGLTGNRAVSTKVDQWEWLIGTFVATTTTHRIQVLSAGPGVAGAPVYADAPLLLVGAYTGPHFDGDSTGATWDGTPNASTSRRQLPALTYWDGAVEQWVSVVGG